MKVRALLAAMLLVIGGAGVAHFGPFERTSPAGADVCYPTDHTIPNLSLPGRATESEKCVDTEPVVTVIIAQAGPTMVTAKVNTTGWEGLGRVHLEAKYYMDGELLGERERDCSPNDMCSLPDRDMACDVGMHVASVSATAWSLDNNKYGEVYGDGEAPCDPPDLG